MGIINVNWNQWAHEVTSDYWRVRDSSYSTATFNGDGTVTVTYSKEGNVAYLGAIYSYPATYQVRQVNGDIWYGSYMVNASEEAQWCGEIASGARSAVKKIFPANTWNRWSAFQPANERKKPFYFPYCESATIGMTAQAKAPIWINLTQMYGAGNEPSTVEEFEHQCEINGINLNEYQPYTTGIVKSWRTSGDGTLSTATTSGNIASFWSPARADIKSCKMHFSPLQEGSGDPSPTNVRNISGWNGINGCHTRKNLLNIDALISSPSNIVNNFNFKHYLELKLKPNTYYTVSTSYNDSGLNVLYANGTNGDKSGVKADTPRTILSSSNGIVFLMLYDRDGIEKFENKEVTVQLEEGNIVTSYEPINNIPVSWESEAGTIYGGYVDLVSGELVAEWINIPTSIINYDSANTNTRTYRLYCDYYITDLKSNIFNRQDSSDTPNIAAIVKNTSNGIWIKVPKDEVPDTTIATGQKYLDDNDAVFIVKLKTPITYQLTPQQLTSFIGRNNIWSESGGNVEVEYDLYESADITLAKKKIYLSSPHIESKSGSVATFDTDMKAPLKECKLHFLPIQEGSGDPSLDNIRPISGWTGFNAYQVKSDIFVISYRTGDTTSYNVKFNVDKYGKITANGTPTSYSSRPFADVTVEGTEILRGRFCGNLNNLTSNASIIYDSNWNRIGSTGDAGLATGIDLSNYEGAKYVTCVIKRNRNDVFMSGSCFVALTKDGTLPDLNTIPITFPSEAGTLYGGYIDLVNGELVQTHSFLLLNENKNQIGAFYAESDRVRIGFPKGYSSDVDYGANKTTMVMASNMQIHENGTSASTDILPSIGVGRSNSSIYVSLPLSYGVTDATSASEWISNNPIQLVYKLATPITYQLTPQIIKTLIGRNNIWSDAGDVEVKYWKH